MTADQSQARSRPVGFEYAALCCGCGARRTVRRGGALNRQPRGYDAENRTCQLKCAAAASCGITKHAIIEVGVPTARRPLNKDEEWAGLVELAAADNITVRILPRESGWWGKAEAARLIRFLDTEESDLLISDRCTPPERIEMLHHVLMELLTTDDRNMHWDLFSATRSSLRRPYATLRYSFTEWTAAVEECSGIHTESKGWG